MALEYSPSEKFLQTAFVQAVGPAGFDESLDKINGEYELEKELYDPFHSELKSTQKIPYHFVTNIAQILGVGRSTFLLVDGDGNRGDSSPHIRDAPPEDTTWLLVDGKSAADEVVFSIQESLEDAFNAASSERIIGPSEPGWENPFDSLFWKREHCLEALQRKGGFAWLTPKRGLAQRICDTKGAYVAIGYSKLTPSKVYQLDWTGEYNRYTSLQQDHPFYCKFLVEYFDELGLNFMDRLSLHDYLEKNGRSLDEIMPPDWREIHPECKFQAGIEKLKNFSISFLPSTEEYKTRTVLSEVAVAQCSVRTLRHLVLLNDYLMDNQHKYGDLIESTSRSERVPVLTEVQEHSRDLVEFVEVLLEGNKFEKDYPSGHSSDLHTFLFQSRWLVSTSRMLIEDCEVWAKELDAVEAANLFATAKHQLQSFDESLVPPFSGISKYSQFLKRCGNIKEIVSRGVALCYGQIFYRDSADNDLVIDRAVKEEIFGETHEIKKLLERSIEDFERRVIPNLTLQPLVGLVEEFVRKMSRAWDPEGPKTGVSAMLSSLGSLCQKQKPSRSTNNIELYDDEEQEQCVEWLFKSYAVNVAWACYQLSNCLRHYPRSRLQRHDAGVMLHGILSIISKLEQYKE